MTLAEMMLKQWQEEVENRTGIYRTFGSSRNCGNCYFSNLYHHYFVCRYHFTGIPGMLREYKCKHWSEK